MTALDDISLTINDGEFVGIIGHTGCGKSTLVQHLNGLLKATDGVIYFGEQNIYDKNYNLKDLRSHVGMVFQYPEHQLFEASVIDDVCFGPKNMGVPAEEAKDRALKALALVGFPDDMINKSPFELSGGQKRRAAIAGVLAMQPDVIILDEPTAGLDPRGRTAILDLVANMHRELGSTIVLVSHSMEDVAAYVDRILVIDQGRLQYDGTPKEVFSHPTELEEMGLAVPQVTYLMNDLREAGIEVGQATTIEEALEEVEKIL